MRRMTLDSISARSSSSPAYADVPIMSMRIKATTYRPNTILSGRAAKSLAHHAHFALAVALDEQVGQRVLGVLRRELRLDAFELARGQHLLDDELGLEVGERRFRQADAVDHLLVDAFRQLQPLLRR